MSLRSSSRVDSSKSNASTRLRPVAPKRSLVPIVGGMLIIFVFALVFGVAFLRSGHREAVLVVDKSVSAGTPLSAGDLRTVRIASDGGIQPIPASRLRAIVGRPVSVSLVPGTLLSESQLGAKSELNTNDAVVGVSLKSGQYPPALGPGSTVRVVQTDATGNVSLVDAATVLSVGAPDSNHGDTSVIGLKVPTTSANAVVGAASASHVSLVQVVTGQ